MSDDRPKNMWDFLSDAWQSLLCFAALILCTPLGWIGLLIIYMIIRGE